MIGRLASDPTAGQTQNGKSKSSFRIAVPRQFKKSEADFFMVVAFNNTADFVNSYLTKGRMVALDGSIQNRSYQAQLSQMEYAAENGYTDTLKAQFTTLMKQMARLEMIEKNVLAARGF